MSSKKSSKSKVASAGVGAENVGAEGAELKTAENGSVSGKVDSSAETSVESSSEKEVELLEEDAEGNRYLPGQEVPVPVLIKPLVNKAKEIEAQLKPAFGRARDALLMAQDELADLAHRNIEHFSEPDEKGKRTYRAGGVIISITFEKEKIVTKLDEEE